MAFNKRVITTKRNHIYYGPTESKKTAVTLEEVAVDLTNIYDRFEEQSDEFVAVASGYLDPSGLLRDMKSYISEIENRFDKSIYIQATQPSSITSSASSPITIYSYLYGDDGLFVTDDAGEALFV